MTREELERELGATVYIHSDEIEPIARYAAEAARVIVEIGTAYGATAALMLKHAPKRAHLTSIDPFVTDSHGGWRASLEAARSTVERTGHLGRWTLIQGYSYDVVTTWKTPIDLLFLDGDHSYPAVRGDFDQWLSHMKSGGIILLHDSRRVPGTPAHEFNQGWPGPTRLADELRSDDRVTLIEEAHSLTIWRVGGDHD